MSDKQLDKVSFEFIRYSNCWEDANVLLKGLNPDRNSKIISIGSAGDNCFSLLTHAPKRVVAVDVSPVQLYLVELKKVAIQNFSREEFLAFAGYRGSNDRLALYERIKFDLSKACLAYWNQHLSDVEKGVVHIGKFEQYFQLFRKEYLLKIHNQSIINELFRSKSQADQRKFHDTVWHTDAWKKMYREFFGKKMMGEAGRDPEFLKYVEGEVSDIILQREMDHISSVPAQSNYFLYYILNNRFDEEYLPHYVKEINYELVKENLDKLFLHNGLLESAFEIYPDNTHFNLSDIFEYMDVELFKQVAKNILDHAEKGAKIAYWNLMIPRSISRHFTEVKYLKEESEHLSEIDPGYFYGAFIVDQKHE